jgi:hypothetical protein
MARTRAWRRWKRYTTMMRRLKKDWNQHYRNLVCPCRTDPKFRSIMADTPKRCSAACCGNGRRYEKGKAKVSLQERRAGIPWDD